MSAAPATWPEIVAAVAAREDALLERLRRVIAIDTAVPPGHTYPAAAPSGAM